MDRMQLFAHLGSTCFYLVFYAACYLWWFALSTGTGWIFWARQQLLSAWVDHGCFLDGKSIFRLSFPPFRALFVSLEFMVCNLLHFALVCHGFWARKGKGVCVAIIGHWVHYFTLSNILFIPVTSGVLKIRFICLGYFGGNCLDDCSGFCWWFQPSFVANNNQPCSVGALGDSSPCSSAFSTLLWQILPFFIGWVSGTIWSACWYFPTTSTMQQSPWFIYCLGKSFTSTSAISSSLVKFGWLLACHIFLRLPYLPPPGWFLLSCCCPSGFPFFGGPCIFHYAWCPFFQMLGFGIFSVCLFVTTWLRLTSFLLFSTTIWGWLLCWFCIFWY